MTLYPHCEPFNQINLAVDDLHTLYVEECGNPRGVPVVVLHGGPGGGCSPLYRRYFDPQYWRIILFDQRGAGRSTPRAETRNNTSAHLVADMEQIRTLLGIDQWALFGGSWGATLALQYAQQYSQQVLGLVLRGVFLCRQQDMNWLYGPGGAARLQPEAWQALVAPLADDERSAPLHAYHRLLGEGEQDKRLFYAGLWAGWEAACATLNPSEAVQQGFASQALPIAAIETHFFVNDGFMLQPILDNMTALAGLPGFIVHGRYDLVCPVEQALSLHQAWPGSELTIVAEAGHSMSEPGILNGVLAAITSLRAALGGKA